jgi:hypothetical protein
MGFVGVQGGPIEPRLIKNIPVPWNGFGQIVRDELKRGSKFVAPYARMSSADIVQLVERLTH